MTTKVSFRLGAEFVADASEGLLLGDFNNWNPEEAVQLKKQDDGSLSAEISLTTGRTYQYRYLLNDGRWVNDFSGTTTWVEAFGNYVENNIVEVAAILTPAPAPAKTKKPVAVKKATVAAPKPAADDLSKIAGLPKKVAALLKKNNIIGFKDLSKCTLKNLKTMLENAGDEFKTYNPTHWPKQAKLAASGQWDELQSLQISLKAKK